MKAIAALLFVVVTSVLLLSTASIFFQEDAEAIPAFARKYKVSCTMCHIAAPKLKPYGEEFAGNGFVLPDGEEPKRSTIDTGDGLLLLMRSLPLAVRFDAYLRAQQHEAVDADLQVPYGLKLLSGGRLAKMVSYYFYFYVYERGEVAGLEDAYLHFNNLGGVDFDIMAGQFQISDPLFKRELRLTLEDYIIYRVRVGDSRANLTYDRGLMFTYGTDFDMGLFGQVVNGNGIPEAENQLFDLDTDKGYSLRVSQGLGWLRLGLFGYYTTEKDTTKTENEVWYAGADGTIGGEKWELNVQYMRREDSNPTFAQADSVSSVLDGGFVEFVLMPRGDRSRWLLTALWNGIEGTGETYDTHRGTLSLSHMAARNLRFLFEYTQDFEEEQGSFTFGAMGAF